MVLNGMVVSAVVVVVMIKLLSAFLVLGKHVCVCVCVCVLEKQWKMDCLLCSGVSGIECVVVSAVVVVVMMIKSLSAFWWWLTGARYAKEKKRD